MYKFEFIPNDYDDVSNSYYHHIIVEKDRNDLTVDEVADLFKYFLLAVGFSKETIEEVLEPDP
jgi:hypothetical protein